MKRVSIIILLHTLLFSAHAQSATKPTPEELAEFFDRSVPALMEEHHVVGAVVGVTDGAGTLFLRGYGSADRENGVPVDPEATLFRAGSISKLFTWTAIMQLEERRLLDLNDPVEEYLDFELPDTFEAPIRIRDLMNHTPGFEDRMNGLFVKDQRLYRTLRDLVSEDIPRRVRPPGEEVSYSNYGTMLAGYIVERLTGMAYEDYVERKILYPLGMDSSTFRQPLPPELADKLANAYTFTGGQYLRQGFEFVNGAPAGSLSTTAADLLRFYRAYLNYGRLDGTDILQEDTVLRMRRPSFRHDSRANGVAHGFFEIGLGEARGYGHGGDTMLFHSISGYLPEHDLAYFVSTNTATGMLLTHTLGNRFLSEFYPVRTGAELSSESEREPDLQEYTGVFAMNRRSESDPFQILGAATLAIPRVTDDGEGLWIAYMMNPKGSVYLPVARDIFQERDGRARIVFLRDEQGRVRSLYSNEMPAFLFARPPWIEHPVLSVVVLLLGILFLLTGLIAPPTGLLTLFPRLRSKTGGVERLLTLWSGRAYLALFLAQILAIVSLGDFFFVPIGPVNVIPLYLAAAAAVVMLVSAVLAWRNKLFRLLGRLHYSAFALSQALLVAWLGYWGFFFL